MHNTYESKSGKVILINEDVLVRRLPLRTQTESGILLPETAGELGEAGIMASGVILAYGFVLPKKLGRKIPIPQLNVGDHVVFIRFLAEQHTNKYMQHVVEKDVFRIKPQDILLIHGPEEAVL